jgi:hypothetical protein
MLPSAEPLTPQHFGRVGGVISSQRKLVRLYSTLLLLVLHIVCACTLHSLHLYSAVLRGSADWKRAFRPRSYPVYIRAHRLCSLGSSGSRASRAYASENCFRLGPKDSRCADNYFHTQVAAWECSATKRRGNRVDRHSRVTGNRRPWSANHVESVLLLPLQHMQMQHHHSPCSDIVGGTPL